MVTSKEVPYIGKSVYICDIIDGVEEGFSGEKSIDPKGNETLKVYDKVGRLLRVTVDGKSSIYSYYDNGSLRSITYPEGHSEEYTYYKNRLLKTLVNKKSDGSIIESYSYFYDAANNLIRKIDAKGSTSYEYDSIK